MTEPSRAPSSAASLREHAESIWNGGVDGVRAAGLVRERLHVDAEGLRVDELTIPFHPGMRVSVVGAGKAGGGMAAGLEAAFGPALMQRLDLTGWINVPERTADSPPAPPLQAIHLHAARPAGCNEPTAEAE